MRIARLAAFAAAVLLAACTGSTNPDDLAANDATDTATDARLPPTPSGVTTAMCSNTIDMTALGTLTGDTTNIHGSTATPTDVMNGPCSQATTGQQVYRYRVRGAQVSLQVTTALPGGTPRLDTAVWVLGGACAESTMPIACNDDDPNTDESLAGTSTLRTPVLAGGSDVFIVVGSYAGARRGAAARGEFNLAVAEIPAAAAGAMCDSAQAGSCVSGYECAATSPTAGLCVQPSQETEPNDTTAMPMSITFGAPISIHASIMPAGDHDCFAFDAPGGRNLYVEVSDGAGSCPADLAMDLFRMGETDAFEGDDDSGRASSVACPRVDAMENPGVQALAAGRYFACVRAAEYSMTAPTMTVPQYSVQFTFE
jgi:hypothetical protein